MRKSFPITVKTWRILPRLAWFYSFARHEISGAQSVDNRLHSSYYSSVWWQPPSNKQVEKAGCIWRLCHREQNSDEAVHERDTNEPDRLVYYLLRISGTISSFCLSKLPFYRLASPESRAVAAPSDASSTSSRVLRAPSRPSATNSTLTYSLYTFDRHALYNKLWYFFRSLFFPFS